MLVLDTEPVFAAGAVAVLGRAGMAGRVGAPDDAAILTAALTAAQTAAQPGAQPDVADAGRQGVPAPDEPAASILVLDSALSGAPGLTGLVRGARLSWPEAGVVLVLRRAQQEGLLGLLGAGARALVHRRCSPEELVTAAEAAAAGRTWVSGPLAGALRAESLAERSGHRPAALSARELEVLRRLATGATNAAIGRSLGISDNTVRNHVHAILAKLGAANRTDAVALAARRGIVEISG